MAERKSQPRKADVVVDEEAQKRRDRYKLAVLLIGGVAVVEVMGIIAGFLSNDAAGIPTWLYIALGVTVGLGVVVYLLGRFTGNRPAKPAAKAAKKA